MALRIEIGKTYVDGLGTKHRIVSVTKVNPDWVCTYAANWFEQSTGRAIWYSPKTGHYVLDSDARALQHEVEE